MTAALESLLFGRRRYVVLTFALLTVVLAYFATQLRLDAGFTKFLPLTHPYTKTLLQYRDQFGGGDRIVVALVRRQGDIFNADFLKRLKVVTEALAGIEGIERAKVKSLFTPNVRYMEVVEGGFTGGTVVPQGFQGTAEQIAQVRANVAKAGLIGTLVSADLQGAMITAELREQDPATGKKTDYRAVAKWLEHDIRGKYQDADVRIHILGFAKLVGDIADAASNVLLVSIATLLITALLFYLFTHSLRLTAITLGCALLAVLWQLGLLSVFKYGLDPVAILVSFLIFAIAASHAVQMINTFRNEYAQQHAGLPAARTAFRRLLIPGALALAADVIGFLTISLIDIPVIRDMAVTATLGVAVILLINLILLPVLLSYLHDLRAPDTASHRGRLSAALSNWVRAVPRYFARFAQPRHAAVALALSLLILVSALWLGRGLTIGDVHAGVPELRQDARYNQDVASITQHFTVAVDSLAVIVEAEPEACTHYDTMSKIDEFTWRMSNVPGVRSAISLASLARRSNAYWNEGYPKWTVLPRNASQLAASVSSFDTDSGLLNFDCSVMPVYLYTQDHKADTLRRMVAAVKGFNAEFGDKHLRFRLASGNLGVMAATNEAVEAAQLPIVLNVFAAITILCLLAFRSWRAAVCIIYPLALVSALAYALMAVAEIGLKVATLPVVALGAGIGVDYAIYLYSQMRIYLRQGDALPLAYRRTLETTGSAVFFTALTLAAGVSVWMFSLLKFQADLGLLLTFMFLANMVAALILLPALAVWLQPRATQTTT